MLCSNARSVSGSETSLFMTLLPSPKCMVRANVNSVLRAPKARPERPLRPARKRFQNPSARRANLARRAGAARRQLPCTAPCSVKLRSVRALLQRRVTPDKEAHE